MPEVRGGSNPHLAVDHTLVEGILLVVDTHLVGGILLVVGHILLRPWDTSVLVPIHSTSVRRCILNGIRPERGHGIASRTSDLELSTRRSHIFGVVG